MYTIASPDEYLAITGAGVKTVKICKSAWVWPMQRVSAPVLLSQIPQNLIVSHQFGHSNANANSANASPSNRMTIP